MKKLLLLFVMLSSISYTQEYSAWDISVRARLDSLLAQPFFDTANAAVSVFDLTKGRELYEHRSRQLMRPASNMKVLTTASALYFLKGSYQFTTSFYYTGERQDSVINGDLYTVGGCDPDFSLEDLDSIAQKIASSGIRRINGNVYADVSFMDTLFWGKGWMWDDDPSTDFPYMSALNINSNSVRVRITPGEPGQRPVVTTYPLSSFFTIKNYAVTAVDTPYTFSWDRDWIHRTNDIVLKGRYPAARSYAGDEINVYRPSMYFIRLLKEKLNSYGVSVAPGEEAEKVLPNGAILLAEKRRPLSEVLINLNKTSDNLSAEMTLRALAQRSYGSPATAQYGIKMVDSLITLSGLDRRNYRIVDGSGVSHYNLISPELLMNVLRCLYYSDPSSYSLLYDSFPAAGVDGTLRNRMKGTKASGNVHAKTGTLTGVSSLSGYVRNPDGDLLAFSIIINGYTGPSSRATRWQDAICRILAGE